MFQKSGNVFDVLLDLERDFMACGVGSWVANGLDEPVDVFRIQFCEDGDTVDAVIIDKIIGNSLCHTDADKELS